jgi:hypothetical protein
MTGGMSEYEKARLSWQGNPEAALVDTIEIRFVEQNESEHAGGV